jgi:hypothetical protein
MPSIRETFTLTRKVLSDAVQPAKELGERASALWGVAVFLGLTSWALIPAIPVPNAWRIASGALLLAGALLRHAGRLQRALDDAQSKNILIKDRQGLLDKIAEHRKIGTVFLGFCGTKPVAEARFYFNRWEKDVLPVLFDQADRETVMKFIGARAVGPSTYVLDRGPDRHELLCRMQGRLDVLDEFANRVLRIAPLQRQP